MKTTKTVPRPSPIYIRLDPDLNERLRRVHAERCRVTPGVPLGSIIKEAIVLLLAREGA